MSDYLPPVLILILFIVLGLLYIAARLARIRKPKASHRGILETPCAILMAAKRKDAAESNKKFAKLTSVDFWEVGPPSQPDEVSPDIRTDGCSTWFPPGYNGGGIAHTLGMADVYRSKKNE
jgi:hypothetical protein